MMLKQWQLIHIDIDLYENKKKRWTVMIWECVLQQRTNILQEIYNGKYLWWITNEGIMGAKNFKTF